MSFRKWLKCLFPPSSGELRQREQKYQSYTRDRDNLIGKLKEARHANNLASDYNTRVRHLLEGVINEARNSNTEYKRDTPRK